MIFRSPFTPVAIPDSPLTPYVLRHAQALADKPALIDGPTGRTLTYGQLAGDTRRAAVGLARRGFGKGDVLALCSPNRPEYALAFFATASLGGVVTPINPLYTARELAAQLKDAGASVLVTVPAVLDKAAEAAREAGVEALFVFGEAPGATPFAVLLEEDGEPPAVAIDPAQDLAVLPYSSGTTGLPKGVMLTHRNLVANLAQLEGAAQADPLTPEDTVVGVLPFFHIYGLTCILCAPLAKGATVVTLPRFEMASFLETLERYQVTQAALVPPIVLGLVKHPDVRRYNLSRLRRINSGAAPLGAEVAAAAAERIGALVTQGYGLTETSPGVFVSGSAPGQSRPGASGRLVPSTEALVVDRVSGDALGPGGRGELWVRGPQVMKGYLNRPQETAAVLDNEGWFRTGDVVTIDQDGFLFVVDRLKELIKYKGQQVAPAELEALLLTHPAVLDAAVIPSPDEEAGEVPKAFVVTREPTTAESLMAFVAAEVAPHKKIRRLEFVARIPKSASGKILRRQLIERERAALASGAAGTAAPPPNALGAP